MIRVISINDNNLFEGVWIQLFFLPVWAAVKNSLTSLEEYIYIYKFKSDAH